MFQLSFGLQRVENNVNELEAGVIWNGCNLNGLHIFVIFKKTWEKTIMPFKEIFTLKNNLKSFYSFRKCLRDLWGTKDYFSFTYTFFEDFYVIDRNISKKREIKVNLTLSKDRDCQKWKSPDCQKWKTTNTPNHNLPRRN